MTNQRARIPAPRTEQWDWQRYAACRRIDDAVFFPPEGERGTPRQRRENQAKQVCARCPVQQSCLQHALAVEEPYGVWGGLTPAERRSTPSDELGVHAHS